MKWTAKNIALCAVLAALALGLSTLEGLFPISLLVPLPGVKLGLANIVTVFALYQLGAGAALASTAVEIINAYFADHVAGGDVTGENTLLK